MANKAQQTIKIQFKAVGNKPLESAIKSLDRASKNLTKSQRQLVKQGNLLTQVQGKVTQSTHKFGKGLFETEHRTRILGGSLAVLRSKLLVFNFLMGLGARQLATFAQQSAKLEGMEKAFNTLSGGGALASNAVNKLTDATDGTVSKMDLFKQANNAMILGVTKNSDEMAQMFDIAQRLGEALGRDTASSIESLITGIGRQSRLMLDNIGIIVDTKKAYKDYANELSKSVDELTDAEKKQAFFNATMESATLKASKLNKEEENASKAFQRLSADLDNASARLGEHFTPLAIEASKALSGLAKSIDTESINNMGILLTGVAGSFAVYRTAVLGATIATNGFAISSGIATGGITILSGAIIALMAKMSGLFDTPTTEIIELEQKAKDLKNQIQQLEIANLDTKDATIELTEAQKKLKELTEGNIKNIGDEIKALILKKAELQGASQLTLLQLKYGKEFVENNKELINKLIEQTAIVKELEEIKGEISSKERERSKLEQKIQERKIELARELFNIELQANADRLTSLSIQEEFNLKMLERNILYQQEQKFIKDLIKNNAQLATELGLVADMTAEQKATVAIVGSLSDAFINATLNAQNFGDAVESAFKTLLAQLASKAIQFGLMSMFGVIPKGGTSFLKFAFAHTGGYIKEDKTIQRFATGGQVQGEDNVPIMAQAGEFVMSRNAVDSIGIDNLARMNQTGNAGVTINVQGNMIAEESYVRDTLIPEIQKAQGLNLA
jgi:hypothetical protein